jgi:hypothetical protein
MVPGRLNFATTGLEPAVSGLMKINPAPFENAIENNTEVAAAFDWHPRFSGCLA